MTITKLFSGKSDRDEVCVASGITGCNIGVSGITGSNIGLLKYIVSNLMVRYNN